MTGDAPDAPSHDSLPLPDYDHLTLGSLEARIKTLDREGVERLLAFERAHGNRLPVIQVLERRTEALQHGAQPTGGSPDALVPEAAGEPTGGSKVSPQTSGPPINPPSHGDPTNPAQPRT